MDAALNGLSGVQKDELMDQVKQQIAVANAQELLQVRIDQTKLCCAWEILPISHFLQKMTEKCFKKCINKPGTSLDNSEQVLITFFTNYNEPG